MPRVAPALDATHGEVVPQCCLCRTCLGYYESHDPFDDGHSLAVQDDLRRDAAVAVAREIAEYLIFGDGHTIDAAALAVDREKAASRASAIHLWRSSDCYLNGHWTEGTCSDCIGYLAALKGAVGRIIEEHRVRAAISGLAIRLERSRRLATEDIDEILRAAGLEPGSVPTSALPLAPISGTDECRPPKDVDHAQ